MPGACPGCRGCTTWSGCGASLEAPEYLIVDRPGRGSLEALVDSGEGRPLVFHHGTPGAAVWTAHLRRAARKAGLRLVNYSRPGYGDSTQQPGRSVADAAADVAALLDFLGADEFLTMGWSGGGPHALACAALLPDRCLAATSLAGVAPYRAAGLDWLAGMATENLEEFNAALEGASVLTPMLEKWAEQLAVVQSGDVAASLGGLVPDIDKRALTGEFADSIAASFRRAVSTGVAGWRDDDLAFVRDWGFDLNVIRCPVAVWQGGQDRMVPFSHGGWLAQHVPHTRVHLDPGQGHLSLIVASMDEIVADLASLAENVR